ncbi:methionine synthase [Trujillonella endophytica]|uniref:Cobalamin-independent synthase, Catalytic domain n=1 Tax=Trujillonella endophytica TaxID=673521 RepID=A0A1H8TID6_9ACTN|nr:methionine synthase [Trujillella endophytica]SEO90637.1 Cobalamin-independent synthase, Catalytic domain [Trujillella endophytica]
MASPTDPQHDATRPTARLWGPATGVGSLPGTDPVEALRVVLGELPDLPHLPELPGRGAGADLLGRATALLVDLAVDLTPAGWRLVPRSGIDQRRAREFLARDLDALHELAEGYTGTFKVQAAGPWTLAAGLERTRGDRAVVDPGARRDLAQSLAEGVAAHVAEVAARLPAARVVVQLDEPSVPAVLQGGLPTITGFGKLPPVEASVVEQELAAVIAALPAAVVVHCCATRAPLELFRAAGAAAVSVDSATVTDLDVIGTAVDAGLHLVLGVVPGTDAVLPAPKATAARLRAWWNELGFPADDLAAAVTLSPACGLAGATPDHARAAMTHVREAARYLLPE